GKLGVGGGVFKGKGMTFHDPWGLGRGNDVYVAARELLEKPGVEVVERKRSRVRGLCCGAGGARMTKGAEKGNREVHIERTEEAGKGNKEGIIERRKEALAIKPDLIATGCTFCITMMIDSVKNKNKESEFKVMDVDEMIASAQDL